MLCIIHLCACTKATLVKVHKIDCHTTGELFDGRLADGARVKVDGCFDEIESRVGVYV